MAQPRVVEVVGDVVRRSAAAWTETIHALLRHLFEAGLPAPEPLGIAAGVETVRFLPGAAGEGAWSHQISLAGVRSAGSLLRAMHEATTSWTVPKGARWAVPREDSATVICHGDPKPPNMVWQQHQAIGLVDWDVARPAPRLSDVAYAMTWISPFFEDDAELRRRGLPCDVDPMGRAEAFLEGYGWAEPVDILAAVTARRRQAIGEVVHLGVRGIEPAATWVADGAPQRWLQSMTTHLHRSAGGSGPR